MKQSMLKAMTNVMPRHLLDLRLNPSGELRDSVAARLADEAPAAHPDPALTPAQCARWSSASARRGSGSATASPARSAAGCWSWSAWRATTPPRTCGTSSRKVRDLRVFEGEDGKPMDRSVAEIGGGVLVVSQFTLYGDVRRGRRPSFDHAARPDGARALYEDFVRELRAAHTPVATGEFQAMMQVELVNDGPVTVLVDSKKAF